MSITTGRKIGVFASLAMLLGSVIGIGIFLKNHSVLRANDWSGVGTLVSWISGGLLSLAAAVVFSEIASFKTKLVDGPPGWAEKVGGKYLGYFTRFNYGVFYFVLLNVAVAFFAAETVIGMFKPAGDYHLGIIAVLAAALLFFFLTMNYLSVLAAGVVQKLTTVIKFIPLIAVVFGGLIMWPGTNLQSASAGNMLLGENAFTNGRTFDFTRMLAALPAVLFAYDAFLVTTQLRHKMQRPAKLPLIVLWGMIAIIALYSLIALSAILHGSGMLSSKFFGDAPQGIGIFDQIVHDQAANIIGHFMLVFICISTLGVLNGISAGAVAMIEQIVRTNTLFGAKYLRVRLKAWAIPTILAVLFTGGFMVVAIPAVVLNSDGYIDALSNFPTLFMFALYGIIILLYTIRRRSHKTEKANHILFYLMAGVAVLGIAFVVGYQIFYGMTTNLLMHPEGNSHAGLFAQHGAFTNRNMAILFFTTLVIFFALPAINYALIKHVEKRQPVVAIETKRELAN